MSPIRTALLAVMLLVVPPLQAQSEATTIADRLQIIFANSGEGKIAVRKLAGKDFTSLAAMLQRRAALNLPDQAEVVALQGAVAFLAGQMNDAIGHFARAAELAPLRDSDSFTLAMVLVSLGDNRQATVLLSNLSGKYPKQSLYAYWLGRIDYDLRLYPEAVKKFQTAVELDPKSSRAWDSLGLAFDMQGQMEPAHDAFVTAVNLNRDLPRPSPWPPHDLGYWCLRMNRLPEAENALRESLRYEPGLAQAHYHLARTLEKDERTEQAIAEYKAAISNDGTLSEACYSLAMLYRKLHRDKEATAMFSEYKLRKEAAKSLGPAKTLEIARPGNSK
jgi:tetratricopeptide (TPR) repeat protein